MMRVFGFYIYQDHLEVLSIYGIAKYSSMDREHRSCKPWGKVNVVLVRSDWIPHQELLPWWLEDEYEAMARSEEMELVTFVELQGESPRRDTIRGIQGWYEVEVVGIHIEEA
jgi:hypothetical protein